jgi:DNA-binding response OmpR family regulator
MDSPPSTKPRVLVVDDSLTVRIGLRGLLTEAGFTVTACDTAASARAALRMGEYALILLDVLLPDGSGLDLLAEIRATPSMGRVPIIMISSQADVWDRIRGLRAGADEWLAKTYDDAYLVRRARELTLGRPAPPSSPGSSGSPSVPGSGPYTEPRTSRGSDPKLDPFAGPPSSREKGNPRVLLVEDNVPYRRKLSTALITGGNDVSFAPTAEQGLDLLTFESFDGVVVSAQVPVMGGFRMCRRIRAGVSMKSLPVLLLVPAATFVEARFTGVDAGADKVMVRAPEVESIIEAARDLLRKPPSGRQSTDRR